MCEVTVFCFFFFLSSGKKAGKNYGIRRMRLQSARTSVITGKRRQRKAKQQRRKGDHQVVKDLNVFNAVTANYFVVTARI